MMHTSLQSRNTYVACTRVCTMLTLRLTCGKAAMKSALETVGPRRASGTRLSTDRLPSSSCSIRSCSARRAPHRTQSLARHTQGAPAAASAADRKQRPALTHAPRPTSLPPILSRLRPFVHPASRDFVGPLRLKPSESVLFGQCGPEMDGGVCVC